MPDLKKYWQEIRSLEQSLPDYVWLTSLDHAAKGQVGGCIVEVAAAVAAKLLHAKSHRLATEEETQAHRASQESTKREALTQQLQHQGITVVPVPRSSGGL
jgi:hypothetical protein